METLNHDPVSNGPSNSIGFCIHCGKPIAAQDKFCASCGHPRVGPVKTGPRHESTILVIAVTIGLFLMLVVTVAVNDWPSTPGSPSFSAASMTESPVDHRYPHFGDGMHIVGRDVQAGTYRTRSASSGCYYARLSGFEGSLDQILANENTDAPAVVTIEPTDKGFKSSRCGTWTQDLSSITASRVSFGDGIFIVGTDIEPGTYRSTGQTGCYYARLRGFRGSLDDILANENSDGPAVVTIQRTDKGFKSSRCGTWSIVTENANPLGTPPTRSGSPAANPSTGAAQEPTPPHSGKSLTAYLLLQNPYIERGRLVELDPRLWPVVFAGRVLKYGINEGGSRQMGYTGMIFNRMIDEHVALFDVQYMDAQNSRGPGLLTAGQIAVIVPPGEPSVSTEQAWTVEPKGVMEGTNGFGAPIQLPLVKFFGYKQNQVKQLEGLAAQNPKDPEVRLKLANFLYDQKQYAQAIEWYQRALELDPKNVNARTDLGTAYFYTDRPQDALREYRKSLAMDPRHEPTLLNMVVVNLEGTHDLAAAQAAWEQLHNVNPTNSALESLKQKLDAAGAAGAPR